ncbi:hypothetical protein ACTFIZ_007633 [Dictyostelium cf. discoideum]
MGNLHSVAQALRTVAPEQGIRISAHTEEILSAERVILPGQGAMPDCMQSLYDSKGLTEIVLEAARNKPLLEINDICYLSEDGFKKLIIIDNGTINTIIREYHDTKYSDHQALDITYNNIR